MARYRINATTLTAHPLKFQRFLGDFNILLRKWSVEIDANGDLFVPCDEAVRPKAEQPKTDVTITFDNAGLTCTDCGWVGKDKRSIRAHITCKHKRHLLNRK